MWNGCLQGLTGGVLLARDREYIVLYRGKDFLPKAIQEALKERDRMASALQVEEEKVRVSSRSKAINLAIDPSEPRYIAVIIYLIWMGLKTAKATP